MKVKLILSLITVKKKLIAAYSTFITYGNTAKDEKKDLKTVESPCTTHEVV